MATEHWLDVLSKAAIGAATRRDIARTLAVFVPGLLLGGAGDAAPGKKGGKGTGKGKGEGKGKSKGNGKKNDKNTAKGKGNGDSGGYRGRNTRERTPPRPASSAEPAAPGPPAPPAEPDPPAPVPPDICDTTWPGEGNQANRDHCRYMRAQCPPGGSREFCIVEGIPSDPAKVAICCNEAAVCCGDRCCGDSREPGRYHCCDGVGIDTRNNNSHCGDCGNVCRRPGWPQNEYCAIDKCLCEVAGTVWDDVCQGCANTQDYVCCDKGASCPKGTVCEFTYRDSSGQAHYRCSAP